MVGGVPWREQSSEASHLVSIREPMIGREGVGGAKPPAVGGGAVAFRNMAAPPT